MKAVIARLYYAGLMLLTALILIVRYLFNF